jgi:Lipocalin-like domain
LQSKLLGAWRLTSYQADRADGDVHYPMGRDAFGYIMYTQNGRMCATVSCPNRAPLSAPPDNGSAQGKAAAFDSYFSYAGMFEVDEANAVVVHHLELALMPNWVGNDFKRRIILDGDKLELRALAPSLVAGEMRTVRVMWERVPEGK